MPELDPAAWLSQHFHVLLASAAGLTVALVTFLAARRVSSDPAAARAAEARAAESEQLAAVEESLFGRALERRMAPRRKGHSVAVVLADGGDDGDVLGGWVEDRSSGGLGVWVDTAVPVGSVLRIRSRDHHASDRVPWAEVRVRTCRARPGGYRLGCQFTQIQPWNVLLTFG